MKAFWVINAILGIAFLVLWGLTLGLNGALGSLAGTTCALSIIGFLEYRKARRGKK